MVHISEDVAGFIGGNTLGNLGAPQTPTVSGGGGGDDDVKLPLSIQPIGGGIGILVDADGVPVVGDDGLPILRSFDEPGGTGGATSFASTQAAQTQAEEFAQAQDEANRRFEAEQAEIDRELRLREARLTTARDLVNIRSLEAREARTQGISLAGDDPFRFTAIARGLAGPTGTTPSAAFKQNLSQAGSFQAPELAGLDSAALESVIGKLSQAITPQQTNLGFAHGGTTSMPTSGSVAIEVGEPINGMPNPEIVILRPDGTVEVVQKTGSAQTGGVFDFGGFRSLFNSLRSSVGLTNQPGFGGALPSAASPRDVLTPESASLLGVRQRGLFGGGGGLVRDPRTGQIFVVTNQGLRHVGSPEALGAFAPGIEAENLSAMSLDRLFAGLGRGEQLNLEEARNFQLPEPRGGSFGAFAEPLSIFQGQRQLAAADVNDAFTQQEADRITQLIGFLPAPHKIPPSFFQSLLPEEKNVLIRAYRLAGVPETDFTFLRTAPQLSFAPRAATAVG